jgi:hypothetical protein
MFRHLLWKRPDIGFNKKLYAPLPVPSILQNQLLEITPDAMALPQLILGSHPLPRIDAIDSSIIVLPDPLKLPAYFVMPSLLSQFLTKVEVWANLDGEYKLYHTSTDMIFRRIFGVKANYRLVGYFKADNYVNQEIKTSPIYEAPSDLGFIGAGVVSGLAAEASIFAGVNSIINSDVYFYTGISTQSYESPLLEASIFPVETTTTNNDVFFFTSISQRDALGEIAESSSFISSTTTTNNQYTWSTAGTIFN